MAKKESKVYIVKARLKRISDYTNDVILERHEVEQIAVSEKQAISRAKWNYRWYNSESSDGSIEYQWEFEAECKTPENLGYEQLTLF